MAGAAGEPADQTALLTDRLLQAQHGEIFFGIITRQVIRRGTFRSVKELTTAIGVFIDAYNTRCQPFAWTKTSEDILTRAGRQRRQPK